MSCDTAVPRPRARRPLVALACAAVVAAVLPLTATLPSSDAAPAAPAAAPAAVAAPVGVVPATPAFGAAIDSPADYQGQSLCSPKAKLGATKLAALIRATYGTSSIGISRACSDGGVSEHKEGRALDWMLNVKNAAQKAKADSFLSWLLAKDKYGNAAAMARRLGVMYIGWNNKFWRGYDIARGWDDLKGCSTDPAKKKSSYDTYCHRNHIHLSLSWEGASALTSFWTGAPLAPSCTLDWSTPAGTAPVAGGDLVPITPVRVLDTRTGAGQASACRLGQSRWSGDRRELVVPVLGQGSVPRSHVAAVAVRVTVSRTSGLLPTVSARATSTGTFVPVVSMPSTAAQASTIVLPLSGDGTFRLSIDRGSADVQVDVLAWAPVAPATPTAATVPATKGLTHVVTPTEVYDGSSSPLKPGESRTVTIAGKGGVPASGATGLAMSITAQRTGTSTLVAVLSGSSPLYVGSLRTSTVASRATQLVVPTSDGKVTLVNTGTTAAVVRLAVQGWVSGSAITGGGPLRLFAGPVRIVDSTAKIGLPGPFTSTAVRTVPVAGRAGVPVGVRGVLLSVSAFGGSTKGVVTVASAGSTPVITLNPRRWAHEVVLVPLNDAGTIGLSTGSLGAQVRVKVIGYVS